MNDSGQARTPFSLKLIIEILGVICILTLVAALSVFIRLGDGEEARSEDTDRMAIIEWLSGGNNELEDLVRQYVEKNITVFEDFDMAVKAATDSVTAENCTVVKAQSDGSHDKNEYTVLFRGKQFLEVTVDRDQKISASLSDGCELGDRFVIHVPLGSEVKINGVTAERGLITKSGERYYLLTEFDSDISSEFTCDVYTAGVLFTAPRIDVSYLGNTLALGGSEGENLYYSYPLGYRRDVFISVPEGAAVTLNGVAAGEGYITNAKCPYPFLSEYETESGTGVVYTEYTFRGLMREPDIKVEYNGEYLESDRDGRYYLPSGMLREYTFYAPNTATVKINGISVSPEDMADDIPLDLVLGAEKYFTSLPCLKKYRISGLVNIPTVAVSDENGKRLSLDPYFTDKAVFSSNSRSTPPEDDEVTLKAFARNYLLYHFGGGNSIGKNYNGVTAMVYGSSPALAKIKGEYREIARADGHRSISFDGEEYFDFTCYEGKVYSCKVKLVMTSKVNGNEQVSEYTVEILYKFSGKIRRVISFVLY